MSQFPNFDVNQLLAMLSKYAQPPMPNKGAAPVTNMASTLAAASGPMPQGTPPMDAAKAGLQAPMRTMDYIPARDGVRPGYDEQFSGLLSGKNKTPDWYNSMTGQMEASANPMTGMLGGQGPMKNAGESYFAQASKPKPPTGGGLKMRPTNAIPKMERLSPGVYRNQAGAMVKPKGGKF